MFGRRGKEKPDHEQGVDVDLALERDISRVEQAVDSYLGNPNESLRKDLIAELEELDDQLAEGDAYHARLRFPIAGAESVVIGAKSASSVGEALPATEFQAQVTLVKAAKIAVSRLTPDTLADLQDASKALARWRT
jgi:hypothetical protein